MYRDQDDGPICQRIKEAKDGIIFLEEYFFGIHNYGFLNSCVNFLSVKV